MQEQQRQEGQGGAGGLDNLTPEEIAQMLMQALMNGDQGMMRAMAKQAVQRFAGMEPGRPVGGTYYLYRTLRNLDLDGMLEKLMEASREQVDGDLTSLEERLERENTRIASRSSRARSRPRSGGVVADRGGGDGKTLRKPLPEDVEFMHASRRMVALKKSLYPLRASSPPAWPASAGTAQGPRLPQHRAPLTQLRRGAGRAEVQVPAARQARADRGRRHLRSVAAFARFTLMLVMRSRTSSRRCARSCSSTASTRSPTTPGHRGHHRGDPSREHRADVVWVDGHPTGPRARGVLGALRQGRRSGSRPCPARRCSQQLSRQPGMGREGDPPAGASRLLADPEPKSYWNTGDSIVGEYGTHTDGVYECRNLRQLEQFVEKLA
jgi:hypothetical protein